MLPSSIAYKIRILANRLRCSRCNSDSSSALFVVGDDIKHSIHIGNIEEYRAVFKPISRKLIINKLFRLLPCSSLVRVCTVCGKSRKSRIPDGFLD